MFTLYKHTNTITGKSYIGFTSYTMEERWKQHVYGARKDQNGITRKFWNSIRKNGDTCWAHSILTTCVNFEDAKKLELQLIEQYDTYRHGYNSTKGGDGMNGYSHSVETRAKIGEIGRGVKRSEEFKKHLVNISKQAHQTREYKDYIVSAPDGTMTHITNLKRFCEENQLKIENLRWSLKTGKPCPIVQAGWQAYYGVTRKEETPSFQNLTEDFREQMLKIHLKRARPFMATHIDGRRIESVGLAQWCKKNNLSYRALYVTIARKTHVKSGSAKGWMVQYA